jgi:predicted nucleic acid-binding protein
LDSGALSAISDRRGRVFQYLRRAIEEGAEIAIPTVVIAESTTGTPRDSTVNQFLREFDLTIVPVTESIARSAGSLRFAAGRPRADTIDAIVVAIGDLSNRSIILTGDVGDLRALSLVRGRSHITSLDLG